MDPELRPPLWRKPADRAEWIALGLAVALALLAVAAGILVGITS